VIQRASAEVEAALINMMLPALARHFTHNAIWVNAIYVMAEDETWCIAARQNTLVQLHPQPTIMNSKEVCNGKTTQFISAVDKRKAPKGIVSGS